MESKTERLVLLREELKSLDERKLRVQEEIEDILYEINFENDTNMCATTSIIEEVQAVVLADSAEAFYRNGDREKKDEEQYCSISLLPNSFKCSRMFWGVLLGEEQFNELWVMHVDGWIRQSLKSHQRTIQKETARRLKRFAVMPTTFNEKFIESERNKIVKLADGSVSPYTAWWEVDLVLIPICCPDNHWFLVQFDIYTLELTIFDRNCARVPKEYRNAIMYQYETQILGFLHEINYWGRGKKSIGVAPYVKYAQVTQYPGSYDNSGVFLCMFIHKLLKNASDEFIRSDVSEEIVKNFREMMANIFYSKRKFL